MTNIFVNGQIHIDENETILYKFPSRSNSSKNYSAVQYTAIPSSNRNRHPIISIDERQPGTLTRNGTSLRFLELESEEDAVDVFNKLTGVKIHKFNLSRTKTFCSCKHPKKISIFNNGLWSHLNCRKCNKTIRDKHLEGKTSDFEAVLKQADKMIGKRALKREYRKRR